MPDPIRTWNAAIDREINSGKHRTRREAVAAVVKRDPELHRSFLEAYNSAHGRPAPRPAA